jgi:hypothetical protein
MPTLSLSGVRKKAFFLKKKCPHGISLVSFRKITQFGIIWSVLGGKLLVQLPASFLR